MKKELLPLEKKAATMMMAVLFLLAFAVQANAYPVDKARAHRIATNFMNANGVKSTELVDVSAAAGFSHIYIFNTENGFVLMAADDRVQPILGYSLNGRFDLENIPINKRAWIQGYSDEIKSAIEKQLTAVPEVTQQWRDWTEGNNNRNRYVVVSPMTETLWNQGNPYNLLCPSNSVTGCAATAMAQVMKYWNYPQHGIGSHSYTHNTYGLLSADFQSTTYEWDLMLNDYSGSSTYEQKMAVATLMYHCGVSLNMDYSPSGSGASPALCEGALESYFNYSTDVQHIVRANYSDADWIALLKADLDLGRPILYYGHGSGGGHAFVFDGYNSDDYFHVNWGWGGYCDEYYIVNSLNPGPGGIGSGSYGVYNDGQGAVIGIHPSECTAGNPTNLTYSQNGRDVMLTWNAASNTASYNIYDDDGLIGNTSSTTYSYVAPFGNSTYYVRSVDANGYLSLSSNAVTVTVDYQTPVVVDLAALASGNDVNLSWSAPGWCYPTTPTATVTYGEGPVYWSWSNTYYGQRYPASDMAQYANNAVYKVSTYVKYAGTYTVYVYTASTANNQPDANALAVTMVKNFGLPGWHDFCFDTPIILTGVDDLWVVLKQENTNQTFPAPSFNLDSYNANACYYGTSSPINLFNISTNYSISWLICTYLTDGVYTYNLYRDDACIANNISATAYSDNGLEDGTYTYYVKTNYYGGLTEASNQVSVQVGSTTVTQTTEFNVGWNWYSTYIDQNGINGLEMLENSLGTNGLRIQGKNGSVDYFNNQGSGYWYGNLNAITNEQMYKVRTSAACETEIVGEMALIENHPVTLKNGWNWMGYPLNQSLSLEVALGDYTPEANDVIKGRNASSTYFVNGSSSQWYGGLNTLEPGQGYMYKSNSSEPKTLVFQAGRENGTMESNITPESNTFVPASENYADNMLVTAVIEVNGEEVRSEDYELAAFMGDECRGSVKLMYIEPLGRYVAFLMVFGYKTEDLHFVLTDGNNMSLSDDFIPYETDGIVGTLTEPVTLHFSTLGVEEVLQPLVTIYPNPSRNIFNVKGEGIRKAEVVDAYGQTILSTEVQSGFLQISIDNGIAGTYLLRVITDKGITTKKLILAK